MTFDHLENTKITIAGREHYIRFENGMTGIGSRKYWIDDKIQFQNSLRQSEDITKGNHFIYRIKWRDTPWDKADLIISEKELPKLLNKENEWREPQKLTF